MTVSFASEKNTINSLVKSELTVSIAAINAKPPSIRLSSSLYSSYILKKI